jgi:hypothetical protein
MQTLAFQMENKVGLKNGNSKLSSSALNMTEVKKWA